MGRILKWQKGAPQVIDHLGGFFVAGAPLLDMAGLKEGE